MNGQNKVLTIYVVSEWFRRC